MSVPRDKHILVFAPMSNFIHGATKKKIIEIPTLPAWQCPVVPFKISSKSRPGNRIRISQAWTAPDEDNGADVVLELQLNSIPPFVVKNDDVYITYKVQTLADMFVKSIMVDFPGGAIENLEVDQVVDERLAIKYGGRGFYKLNQPKLRGDFYVIINTYPTKERIAKLNCIKPIPNTNQLKHRSQPKQSYVDGKHYTRLERKHHSDDVYCGGKINELFTSINCFRTN